MPQRREIRITGVVQSVGFRPFVYTLAVRLGLAGFVRNLDGVVLIEAEGCCDTLDVFLEALQTQSPARARIESLVWQSIATTGEHGFRICDSLRDANVETFVSPDVAICNACRSELLDPMNRRYRYPFLNCTQCGPRLTIVQRSPYDRANTTMARFAMCAACWAEYNDPGDRRFHAQTIACSVCGPRLQLVDTDGVVIESNDPVRAAMQRIVAGDIVAIKGLGGYQLVCLASRDSSVRILRNRKRRNEKPFAVMVRDARSAGLLCRVNDTERQLLESDRRPVVLLRKRSERVQVSELVAPASRSLGVMLPCVPLHELMFHEIGDMVLVVTSGNRNDEPIACDDQDAIDRLRGIADLFLVHDCEIHVRCDDSVTQVIADSESLVRRSRGYAPLPIKLPMHCSRPMLAVGGHLKNVFAIARGGNAFLSQHIGDLDHLSARLAMHRDIDLYEQLFGVKPEAIVHDLHPDYGSTIYARQRSQRDSIPTIVTQHHHAHMASCMAEHRLRGKVIGVVFDGSGLGHDGTIWGGEFLVGDYRDVHRVAHLSTARMPGGDSAAHHPWRMALSHMIDANCEHDCCPEITNAAEQELVRKMIRQGINSPWTSSVGRLFDAVASIIRLRDHSSYEGQAAMQLEAIAAQAICPDRYPWLIDRRQDSWIVDTRPLIRAIAGDYRQGVPQPIIARRFHNTLADLVNVTCQRIRESYQINQVVCSGGVFSNAILAQDVAQQLNANEFVVYQHCEVPPGDGGLCLGQLAIAQAQPT